jgi:Phosphatidylinositol N-acetylglucosaminyltransferase
MSSRRRLWLRPEDNSSPNVPQDAQDRPYNDDTHDTIFERFSSRPEPKSLASIVSNTLVVGQEFVLTCLLLAGHRAALREERFRRLNQNPIFDGIHSDRLLVSLGLLWLTLVVSVVQNRFATSKQYKIRHRLTDFLLMAVLLRFLSAVLKTLTASYSSDTVYALAIASLALHLLACDYAYANGYSDDNHRCNEKEDEVAPIVDDKHKRPTFKGGLLSLSSAFFATTLLASRLESNAAVYVFVCSSVVIFALYPAARHLVALKTKEERRWGTSVLKVRS